MKLSTEFHFVVVTALLAAAGVTAEFVNDSDVSNYSSSRDPRPPSIATTQGGVAVPSLTTSLTVGPRGPVLLQDVFLIDKLAHFNRERNPERVVHAKGAGAAGHFTVTHDLSDVTRAAFLRGVGKRTRTLVRFSTVGGERGSGDTWLDPKGFAVKFYTEEGIHDIVGNNLEVFPIRDAMLFPDLNHSRKRNSVTNLHDPTAWWDFTSLRPEATLHTLMLFSTLGSPSSLRGMDGAGVHTFRMVNSTGHPVFVKFHWKSQTPKGYLDREEAARLAGTDPDFLTQDLYESIAHGHFPSWTMYIQVMSLEEAASYPRNPFDPSKFWRREDFPLRQVGILTLDCNPTNYFADIEQAAFSPGNQVGGIEASPDKLLHARMFAYPDAQRHRLGPNFLQLPVNRPINQVRSYERDGTMNYIVNEGEPNYFPNSYGGPVASLAEGKAGSGFFVEGIAERYEDTSSNPEDDFIEARTWLQRDVSAAERRLIAENMAAFLKKAEGGVQERYLDNIAYRISTEFGDTLRILLKK